TFAWDQEDGRPGHETLVSVTFDEAGDGTRMTFRQAVFQSVESRDGHRGGWGSAFDRLEEMLAQE
ncbi:MAG: SRPBCC domain-containing protein, partial [Geminicoccaceae bacterium]